MHISLYVRDRYNDISNLELIDKGLIPEPSDLTEINLALQVVKSSEIDQVEVNPVEEFLPHFSNPVEIDAVAHQNKQKNLSENISSWPTKDISFDNVLRKVAQLAVNEKITPFQILSELYLRLSTKYMASEECIQDVINGIFSVVESSKNLFRMLLL